MENIKFHDIGTVEDDYLKFAVICTIHKGKFVYVRHKDRKTWEIPGGRREQGETIDEAGTRELVEETGAKQFEIKAICDYSVLVEGCPSYGRLYYCELHEIGELPDLEIEEVKLFEKIPTNLTYPNIQPFLHKKVLKLMNLGLVDVND